MQAQLVSLIFCIPRAGFAPKQSDLVLFEPATLRLPQVVYPVGCFSWLALHLFSQHLQPKALPG